MKTKYNLKRAFKIGQILLLCFGLLLSLLRWINAFNDSIVVITPEITYHITNFSISLMAYLVIGSWWQTSGVKFRYIAALGAFLIAANFICETLLGFINTVDIVDAIYGTVGVLISFTYFCFAQKYGLTEIKAENQ
ncbi:MAG: hypothetical protein ACOX5C_09390 [Acutalibacteraceae bacterium]